MESADFYNRIHPYLIGTPSLIIYPNHQIEVVADMNDLRKLVSEYGKIG